MTTKVSTVKFTNDCKIIWPKNFDSKSLTKLLHFGEGFEIVVNWLLLQVIQILGSVQSSVFCDFVVAVFFMLKRFCTLLSHLYVCVHATSCISKKHVIAESDLQKNWAQAHTNLRKTVLAYTKTCRVARKATRSNRSARKSTTTAIPKFKKRKTSQTTTVWEKQVDVLTWPMITRWFGKLSLLLFSVLSQKKKKTTINTHN